MTTERLREIVFNVSNFLTSKKVLIIYAVSMVIIGLSLGGLYFVKGNKKIIGIKSVSVLNSVSSFLPISSDEKKELEVVNSLVQSVTKNDNIERSYMVFLQNNMELRPGGGFLGQYAIVKIKNGGVTSSFVEDANLLDQRISSEIAPQAPYPFKRMLQLKKWKFRDSNFSPDFPTNVEKALYFYKLAGRSGSFDGFFAVNADVFDDILKLTGPISVPGYSGEYTSDNGALKLEEFVEKQYIMNPELDTQNRKMILKKMAPIIIDKLFTLGNITKLAELAHNELKDKNIMINFKDLGLQAKVESMHWDGKVTSDWGGDFLMLVDANMGSMKTDYYIRRSINYDVDLTTEKPTATLTVTYKHTASYGDWRTSDYHTYLRVYTPYGSSFLERAMVGPPATTEEFNKTVFGVVVHTLIGGQTQGVIKYELPQNLDRDNYKLLIQKQSGVGDVPVHIHLKTKDGEFNQDQILQSDLKFGLTRQSNEITAN